MKIRIWSKTGPGSLFPKNQSTSKNHVKRVTMAKSELERAVKGRYTYQPAWGLTNGRAAYCAPEKKIFGHPLFVTVYYLFSEIYIYIVSRKLCSVFPRAFVLSFLVALSLLNLPDVYTKDVRDIEKVLLLLIIITITKLSNLIGYKLPWFQPL